MTVAEIGKKIPVKYLWASSGPLFIVISWFFFRRDVFWWGVLFSMIGLLLWTFFLLIWKGRLFKVEKPESSNLEDHLKNRRLSDEVDLLQERENYRREFLGNISHELKTPLFNIQGYVFTLIEGGVEDERVKYKYLKRIKKSVKRLTYIVKDLDLISELESGRWKLDYKPFDIVALTQEVFDVLEVKAEHNHVKLGFDKPYAPIHVFADVQRIEQVLINLALNAAHYAARVGAEVTVSFTPLPHKKLLIEVADNGVGIAPEHLPRVFERFYCADKSRSRKQCGSGLGLAIVKHIMEAHNEKVHMESREGMGTRVFFELKML